MRKRFQEYKSLIFDCDGVVLDSNRVKSDAFYNAVLDYGEDAACALLKFHQKNGGISRYKKFDHFFDSIFPLNDAEEDKQRSLELYSQHVWGGLLNCDLEPSLEDVSQESQDSTWLIVSGGDQAELRKVFSERGINKYFQGGIFGSPDTKDEILAREVKNGNIGLPALFIGDSKYDYIAAKTAGLDFVFVSQWTEVVDWEDWVKDNKIKSVASLKELLC
jgi:phosphoglycolate phosphatase-like HAD superfamily hydrolase